MNARQDVWQATLSPHPIAERGRRLRWAGGHAGAYAVRDVDGDAGTGLEVADAPVSGLLSPFLEDDHD